MDIKGKLHELLLEDKVAIHLNIANGFFDVNKSVVLTWILLAVLAVLILFLTSGMRVHQPGKRQLFVEYATQWLRGIVGGILGEEAIGYRDFITTILVFIGGANLMGLFGIVPPTMDLNVTIAVAAVAIVMVEAAGIRALGLKGWFKGFAKPMAVITPMNILELAIRPLSLCMRLFGNILGATVIMELIRMAVPIVVPLVFSLYFDIFDGLIQAYVFVFLTSLYIREAVE
ncbi:MAG: F0F1 ATP synthase subunit A [Butyrivibrio sp.]|nr:F0F1 ATP synthase subunit A [Butyrivibrio sp.]